MCRPELTGPPPELRSCGLGPRSGSRSRPQPRFEARFRRSYLEHCARTAELISPSEFASRQAAENQLVVARWFAVLGAVAGATAGLTVASWVLAAVVVAVIGMYGGFPVGAIRREVYGARVEAMARDRAAYRDWSASVAEPEPRCDCTYVNRIHDADCSALGR